MKDWRVSSWLWKRMPAEGDEAKSAGYPVREFVKRALVWAALFGIAHLIGLRAYTSMLSGTVVPEKARVFLGMLYIVLYLGFVFLVPTLLIAAGILKGFTLARAIRSR
jgi:hypothetical protein